jgi:hypothetical protein
VMREEGAACRAAVRARAKADVKSRLRWVVMGMGEKLTSGVAEQSWKMSGGATS